MPGCLVLSRWCTAGVSERHGRVLRLSSGSVQLLPLSSTLAVFMSARISASVVLSDQYLSSGALISDHDQIDLIAITLLFTYCFFLCCSPAFFSLRPTWSFSPNHSIFVSLSLSVIMFRTLVIALPPWAHILAGHTAFLFMLATYTITLGGEECVCAENRWAQLHHDEGLSQGCVCIGVLVCVRVYYMWMNPGIVNKL